MKPSCGQPPQLPTYVIRGSSSHPALQCCPTHHFCRSVQYNRTISVDLMVWDNQQNDKTNTETGPNVAQAVTTILNKLIVMLFCVVCLFVCVCARAPGRPAPRLGLFRCLSCNFVGCPIPGRHRGCRLLANEADRAIAECPYRPKPVRCKGKQEAESTKK